jgi:hypothetical protein
MFMNSEFGFDTTMCILYSTICSTWVILQNTVLYVKISEKYVFFLQEFYLRRRTELSLRKMTRENQKKTTKENNSVWYLYKIPVFFIAKDK